MKPGALARSLLGSFADLLFPARCLACQRLGSLFCRTCRSTASLIGDEICVRCGTPTTVRCLCSMCRRTPPGPLRGMRGAVFYGTPVAFAIHGLKYRGMPALAAPLASYLITYLAAHPLPIAYLAPRGYNQRELLARETGRACKLPVRTDLIERTRHTSPQVHLKSQQRHENVRDAFAPHRRGAVAW